MTLDDIVRWFETLTRDTAGAVGRYYAPEAFFKDPFNEVRGVEPIRRIFEHMFVQVQAPRFVVRELVVDGDAAFLTWDFLFRARRLGEAEQVIHGASHL